MNLHFSNCIYRKIFFLLTFLLVSAQMVLAQQDSTVDTEPKVYGNVYDGTPYYAYTAEGHYENQVEAGLIDPNAEG